MSEQETHALKSWGYQVEDGQVKAELFETEELAEGWYESPEAAQEAAKPKPAAKANAQK